MEDTSLSIPVETGDRDAAASGADWSETIRLHDLPSMPEVVIRLVQSFADPDAPISDIVSLLQSDPALAAKIVHAANSPRFRVGRQVTDLHRATVLLGRKVVTSLALTFTLSDSSLNAEPDREYFREYWLQSVVQLTAMAVFAERYSPADASDYQIIGLLMDIGRLALLSSAEGIYRTVVDEAREMGWPLSVLEARYLGITHAELSARFLALWGLPEPMTSAVRQHHDYQPRRSFPDEVVDDRLVVVARIGAAIGDYFCSTSRGIAWLRLNELMSQEFNADSVEVESFAHAVRVRVDETSDLFQTDARRLCSPLELMSLALKQLAELALSGTESAGRSAVDVAAGIINPDRVEQVTRSSCVDRAIQVYRLSYLEQRFHDYLASSTTDNATTGLLLAAVRTCPGDSEPLAESRDIVMQQVADVLKSSVRPTDIIAREDEDTFAVLVTDVTSDDVERLAVRMLQRFTMRKLRFPDTLDDARVAIGGAVVGAKYADATTLDDLRDRCRAAANCISDTELIQEHTK